MAQPNSAIPSHTTVLSQRQPGQTSRNPTPDTPGYSPSYNGHSGKATGWIQLCCAVAMILVGVAQFLLESPIRFFSFGIWTGFLCYGPAGILGIASSRKRTAVVSAYVTMSVFSVIFAFIMMLFGALSAGINVNASCSALAEPVPCKEGLREGRTTSDAMMAIVGLIETIVAIVGIVLGCAGVCCGNKSSRPVQEISVVHHYPVVASSNQQGVPHVPMDQPPPYRATPLQQLPSYTPQQQQQIYPPQQTFPQQTSAPQRTFPQQTNAPQQTFQQQQAFPHPQTSTQQHYTELQTYQPLMYPNNQGRQNSGLTVNLPQR